VATAWPVRTRLSAGEPAIDSFAGRHRYRALEALPWLAALAAYVLLPSYLPLGAQILAMILFRRRSRLGR
jgi:hypothetical protein